MQEELKKIVEVTGNIRSVADYALQALEESNEVRGKLEKMIASQGKKITVLKGEVQRLQKPREVEEMRFQRSGEGNWWCQKTGDEEMEISDKELKMSSRIIKLEKENQELRGKNDSIMKESEKFRNIATTRYVEIKELREALNKIANVPFTIGSPDSREMQRIAKEELEKGGEEG